MDTGERIAAARIAAGLTQDDLARLIGTSRPNLCRYETGVVKEIPREKIAAIAKALRVSSAYLEGYDVTVTDDVIQLPVTRSNSCIKQRPWSTAGSLLLSAVM